MTDQKTAVYERGDDVEVTLVAKVAQVESDGSLTIRGNDSIGHFTVIVSPEQVTRPLGALPAWDDLSDLDKGAALLHLHKVDNDGADYATQHYPARFHEHRLLVGLDPVTTSEYAQGLDGDNRREMGEEWYAPAPNADEWQRLYDLALDADRRG